MVSNHINFATRSTEIKRSRSNTKCNVVYGDICIGNLGVGDVLISRERTSNTLGVDPLVTSICTDNFGGSTRGDTLHRVTEVEESTRRLITIVVLDRTNSFVIFKRIWGFNTSNITDRPLIGCRICTCRILQRICDDLNKVSNGRCLTHASSAATDRCSTISIVCLRCSLGICCFKCCQSSRRCIGTQSIDGNIHQSCNCSSNCLTSRVSRISSNRSVSHLVPTVGTLLDNSFVSHNADCHRLCLGEGIYSVIFVTSNVCTCHIVTSCIVNKVVTTVCQVVCHRFNHIHDVRQAVDISTRNYQRWILRLSVVQ